MNLPLPDTPSLGITWQQPTFLLPLFCLCSLLGTTQSLATALGMAMIVMLATVACSICMFALARWLPASSSAAVCLVCAGTVLAMLEMSVHASHYALYQQLGVFLPMGVIAGLLLARTDMQVAPSTFAHTLRRAGLMSAGYGLAALVLGAGRELVGHGSLFADANKLLGEWAVPLQMQLFRADMGFLMAILAPGAFVGLGLGVALYNWLWLRVTRHK